MAGIAFSTMTAWRSQYARPHARPAFMPKSAVVPVELRLGLGRIKQRHHEFLRKSGMEACPADF
jgi:hypothetical protein